MYLVFLQLRRENFKTLCRAYHSRPEMKPVALTTGSSLSSAIYAQTALSQPPDYAPDKESDAGHTPRK
jgi:hypothetical protein